MEPRGAYPADRAAALAGVPRTTVHYWARNGILVPSVSAERVRLWSFADLMALRMIHWLRQPKRSEAVGATIPASSMPSIRRALEALRELDEELWTPEKGGRVMVDGSGRVVVLRPDGGAEIDRQGLIDGRALDVLAAFPSNGSLGPNLVEPRPRLRIIPGKLGGAPHVVDTRIETEGLAALERRGLPLEKIQALYPNLDPDDVAQAIDLENQLSSNLAAAA